LRDWTAAVTPLELVLAIIKTELEIVLKLLESMTPEQRQALWTRHEVRQARWDRIVDQFSPKA